MEKNDEGSEEPKGFTVDCFGLLFYGVLIVVFLVVLAVYLHAGVGWLKAILVAGGTGLACTISVILIISRRLGPRGSPGNN